MRPDRLPFRLITPIGVAAIAALGLSVGMAPPPPDTVTFFVGPDGAPYAWTAGDPLVRPAWPPGGTGGLERVNDLALLEGGAAIALIVPASSPGTRRRDAGRVDVVPRSPGARPAPRSVTFPGEGMLVAGAPDGRLYVVAHDRPGGAGAVAQFLVHAFPPDAVKPVGSAALAHPPGGIAVDPTGARLFISAPGRIVTFTTAPLAGSWHYRSPGLNGRLAVIPGSHVIAAIRGREIALFDPAEIDARPAEARRDLADEATAVIALPFAARSVLFSSDGRVGAVSGEGREVAIFDVATRGSVRYVERTNDLASSIEARPIAFVHDDLAVACFPSRRVATLQPSAPPARRAASFPPDPPSPWPTATPGPSPAPSPTPSPSPGPTPSPTATPEPTPLPTATPYPTPGPFPTPRPYPTPTPFPTATPFPTPLPTPTPMPTPFPPAPTPPAAARLTLDGTLRGRRDLVSVIVVYGPDSIVREEVRTAPQADGTWRAGVARPGAYRVVPLGAAGRPLNSAPHFQTIDARESNSTGVDFEILGSP